ncbi:MAG: hypothetical protein FDZ75_04780, partial [Actinobacteria bacterium]
MNNGAIQRRRARRDGDAGFTIVEIAIATAILLMVVVSVMGTLVFASSAEAMSAKRQTALDLANQRIERAKAMNYADVGVIGGNPPGTIPSEESTQGFVITTDVQRMWETIDSTSTESTYKKIVVTVAWQTPRSGSLTVESAIFGRDSYANIADLIVHVVDVDDANAPMSNAIITIDPSLGATQVQYSDSTGTSKFGRLPSGITGVNVDFPP